MGQDENSSNLFRIVEMAKEETVKITKEQPATALQFAKRFLLKWLTENGHPYLFLFRKNLRVTNIQFAELFALIRFHLFKKGQKYIHFYTFDDFIEEVQRLIESLCAGQDFEKLNVNHFVTIYADHIVNVIIIDPLYGSCGVYVPSNLDLDLRNICALSGYIQAAGHLVLLQPVDDYSVDRLVNHLRLHIDRNKKAKKRPFVIYSHEDFEVEDVHQLRDQQYGLDELKIHLNKFYIGSKRLISILDTLKDEFKKDLHIVGPRDVKRIGHKSLRKLIKTYEDIDDSSTIWLLTDHGIDLTTGRVGVRIHPSESRYFICYEQTITNRNPFHIFDEEKPGWVAPVTIPPTLAGAMINIALPLIKPGEGKLSGYDPFCGSGRFIFEASKFSDVEFRGADLNRFAKLITEDNFKIISRSPAQLLVSWHKALKACPASTLKEVKQFIDDQSINPEDIPSSVVAALEEKDILFRLLFCCWLRVQGGHISKPNQRREDQDQNRQRTNSSTINNNEQFFRIYEEIDTLKEKLGELIELRKKSDLKDCPIGLIKFKCFTDDIDFSEAITLSTSGDDILEVKVGEEADIRNFNEESKYDFIVTDPPYGINIPVDDLHNLYRDGLRRIIRALKANGNLVLCVPMKTRVGRRIPYFIHPRFVIRLIFSVAANEGREVIGPQWEVPGEFNELIRPPYYWEAPKSLRRAILHFRFTQQL